MQIQHEKCPRLLRALQAVHCKDGCRDCVCWILEQPGEKVREHGLKEPRLGHGLGIARIEKRVRAAERLQHLDLAREKRFKAGPFFLFAPLRLGLLFRVALLFLLGFRALLVAPLAPKELAAHKPLEKTLGRAVVLAVENPLKDGHLVVRAHKELPPEPRHPETLALGHHERRRRGTAQRRRAARRLDRARERRRSVLDVGWKIRRENLVRKRRERGRGTEREHRVAGRGFRGRERKVRAEARSAFFLCLSLGGETSLAFFLTRLAFFLRLQLGSQTSVALCLSRPFFLLSLGFCCLLPLFCEKQLSSHLFELLFDSLSGCGALAARGRHGGKRAKRWCGEAE
eukprot:Amastigsp_a1789_7.p2 type:complete len:343 gc:universal Amastigsp_a1789_7:1086-58(-)